MCVWGGGHLYILHNCKPDPIPDLKNIGHAGITVVVVEKQLLASRVAQTICPNVLNWK